MKSIKKLIMAAFFMLTICMCGSVCAKASDDFGTSTYYLILSSDNQVDIKTTPDGRALAWIIAAPESIKSAEATIKYDDGKDMLSISGLDAKSIRLYCARLHIGELPCTISRIEARGGADIVLEVANGSYLACDDFAGYSTANTIIPDGNMYKGDQKELTKENVKISIDNSDRLIYTGKAVNPKVHVSFKVMNAEQGTYQEINLTEGTDYTVSYKNNINAGKNAGVTITGKGLYKGSTGVSFEIKACNIQSTSVSVGSCIYDGTAKTPGVTVKLNNSVVDPSNYSLSYTNNVSAGSTAVVTITGKGNMTGSVKKNFTISTLDITKATVTVKAGTYTYTGKEIKPAVTVTYGKAKLPTSDYTVQYTNNTLPGTAKVTVTAKSANLVAKKSVSKTFNIGKATPTISFSSPIKSTWYNANGSHGMTCNPPSDCRGTFSFTSSNPKLLAVDSAGGRLTVKSKTAFGSVVITATFTPQAAYLDRYNKTSIKHTIKVVPNPVKVTSATSPKAGQLTITWANSQKVYNADSYKVYYYKYTDDKEACGPTQELKTKKLTGTTATVSGLTAGKYYIKIVSCYVSNGVVVNGSVSAPYKCVVK